MRITDIRWTVVRLPFREREHASYGVRTGWLNVLIEVDTDAGISGIGETYAASGPWLDAVLGGLSSARRLLLGEDPRDVERLTNRFYRVGNWRTLPRLGNLVFGGIEMACWDVAGKTAGLPLYRLFGGALHDRVGFFGYLQRKAPEVMAAEAQRLVSEGYRVLYFKVGLDRHADYAAVEAVRAAAGPQVALRIDANQAWEVGTAVQRIKELQRFDLDFVEQPVAEDDWEALAQVRARVDVPIAANEGVWTERDLIEIIRHQAADVIVSGALWIGGLGAAIARRFAQEGAHLALLAAPSDQADLQALASALEAQGTAVLTVTGDVAVAADVQAFVDAAVGRLGRLDVLVSNAGFGRFEHFLELPLEHWERILAVNLTGVFLAGQCAARVMAAQGGGCILNTASTNATFGDERMAHYNAAKAGVLGLTRSMALDLAPYGIRVNAVAPGMLHTRNNRALLANAPLWARYRTRIPFDRMAEPEEIAGVYAFLASDDAAYLTGACITADGGLTAGIRWSGWLDQV